MQAERPLILIVGGGIGGLALALAAKRLGLRAIVWERAVELREMGAGLLLTSNAMWILERLGLREASCRAGRPVRTWRILDRQGRVLQTFARASNERFSISITRTAFQDLLRGELSPETLLLNREVVALDPSENGGKIVVRSACGDSCRADVVVGADGGKSLVRTTVFGGGKLRDCGYVGWRALVDHVPAAWADGLITESWGEGGRFGIAPVSDRRSYWYATENAAPGWTVPPEKRKAHLLERFRHWHDPIAQIVEATPEDRILLNTIADHPRLPHWSRDRVALLGDAAHLMTPNLGQGAAMALEDARVLAGCLGQYGCGNPALQQYERRRHRRATWVAWQSRQVGRMIQIEHPWLSWARDAALRLTPDVLGTLALAPVFNFRA